MEPLELISAASAFTASIAHWRGGRIDWRLFWLMAPPSLVGGIAGGLVSGVLPQRLLLGTIAVVVLYGAVEIGRRQRQPPPAVPPSGGTAVAVTIAFAVGVLGGLIGHIAGGVEWALLAAGCLGAVPGAYLGAHLTGRLDDDALLRAIAAILLVAGLALGVQAAVA